MLLIEFFLHIRRQLRQLIGCRDAKLAAFHPVFVVLTQVIRDGRVPGNVGLAFVQCLSDGIALAACDFPGHDAVFKQAV